jgi:hypothetical protein
MQVMRGLAAFCDPPAAPCHMGYLMLPVYLERL